MNIGITCPNFAQFCKPFTFLSFSSFSPPQQGCQKFFWFMEQKPEKCKKSTPNVPNCHKISQMSLKYSKWP
jgi:hypothetical protein